MSAATDRLIEQAYGLLWSEGGGTHHSHAARRLLLSGLDKDGQKRGIDYARENAPRPWNAPVGVTGIWLKNIGDYVIVEAEISGEWVEIIRERADTTYSHIVEPSGMISAFMKSLRLFSKAEDRPNG